MEASVSAPGKVILSGEHAVVYGYPAIVAAVNKRLYLNEKLQVDSDIPIGCGMGSSAAYAVAMSAMEMRLRNNQLDLEKICDNAYQMEKKHHGNPSGVDTTVSTYGGCVWFRKETEQFKVFKNIDIALKFPKLWLHNTGKANESTKEMVEEVVGEMIKRFPDRVDKLFENIEKITRSLLRFILQEERLGLGELITENERYLEELGVVSDFSKILIRKIERLGGAAKISGAGGKKLYSGLILAFHKDEERMKYITTKLKINFFQVEVTEKGVYVER